MPVLTSETKYSADTPAMDVHGVSLGPRQIYFLRLHPARQEPYCFHPRAGLGRNLSVPTRMWTWSVRWELTWDRTFSCCSLLVIMPVGSTASYPALKRCHHEGAWSYAINRLARIGLWIYSRPLSWENITEIAGPETALALLLQIEVPYSQEESRKKRKEASSSESDIYS